MQNLINLADVPVVERVHARAGRFKSQNLIQGEDGTPDNFFMQLSHTFADFESPRHRHNFDQVRIQLKGDADFARDGVMRPGTLAYFPEGVFYGPQSIAGESSTIVLQFGGASGSGYVGEERYQQAVAELKEHGSFDKGIYHSHRDEEGRRKNQDAYEAVWEHIHGRRLEYPKSDYTQPVFLDPATFSFQPEAGQPGVQRKALGRFSARGTRIDVLRLERGASVSLAPHAIVFVLSGQGDARAGAKDGHWTAHSTLRTGDAPELVSATETAELLEIHIPPLSATQGKPA
jgi:hypothetical protein